MRLFVLCCAAALSACQGSPVGDALIGKEKLAQMDDDYCRSIGAAPGTNPYIQCRMFKTAQRDQGHRQAFNRAGASLSAAGQTYRQAAQTPVFVPRQVTCRSQPMGAGTVRTVCN